MNRRLRKFVGALSLTAYLCAQMPARAQDETLPPTPPSANSILNFISAAFELTDPSDPMNWVAYSAITSWILYKSFFRSSIDFAKGTRDGVLRELEKSNLSKTEKAKMMAELDQKIADVERDARRAERAVPLLNRWMGENLLDQVIASGVRADRVPLEGLPGYQRLERWLQSPEGTAFLATDQGAKWNATYQGLKNVASTNLDKSVDAFLTSANSFDATKRFLPIESDIHGGGLPGNFSIRNDHEYTRTPVPISRIPLLMRNGHRQCDLANQAAAAGYEKLKQQAKWGRFWSEKQHLRPILYYGALTGGAMWSTGWMVRTYNYRQRKAEAERHSRQTSDAQADIFGWLSTNKGREAMAPYYEIFLHSLREHKQQLVEMFEKELTVDERKRFNIGKLIEEALNPPKDANGQPIYPDELISAVGAAAKKHQGDRTAPKALQDFIAHAKTDKATREGLFRAFNKDVLMGFVNKKWPDFTVGNPSDYFKVGTMRSIQDRVVDLLEDDKKMLAPPARSVPPAPGVAPMPAPQGPALGANAVPPNPLTLTQPNQPSPTNVPTMAPPVTSVGGL